MLNNLFNIKLTIAFVTFQELTCHIAEFESVLTFKTTN